MKNRRASLGSWSGVSTNLGASERPSWLPAGNAAASAVAPAPAATLQGPPASASQRTYAEWFAWARRNTPDAGRCHAAAAAAVGALDAGQDHAAAARLAQVAAMAPDAPTRPVTADPQTQAYAAWYTYAAVDHAMESSKAHTYAQAAALAQARGAEVNAAAAEGARASLAGPTPVYTPPPAPGAAYAPAPPGPGLATRIGTFGLGFSFESLFMDPAGRACLYGVLCLVAPFVIHIYFPILPILGLLYGLRAMGRSNPTLGMAALLLNGLAVLLTASIFFGLI